MEIYLEKIFLLCGTGPATNKAIEAACMLAIKRSASIEAHFMVKRDSDSAEQKYLADYSQSQGIQLDTHTHEHTDWQAICKESCTSQDSLVIVADIDEYLLSANKKNGLILLRKLRHVPILYVRYHEGSLFDKILCPVMIDTKSKEKVRQASYLANIFKSSVHLYGVGKKANEYLDSYIRQAERHLVEQGLKHTTKNVISRTPSRSIASYAEEIDAGLIVKSRSTAFRPFFKDSYLKVFTHSNKSILLLPSR